MPVFAYTAVDVGGRAANGTVIADTPAAGRDQLRERGLTILSFKKAATLAFSFRWRGRSAKRAEQVAEMARYLSLLLRAGVPLVESLDVLAAQLSGTLGTVTKELRDKVASGETLAAALGAHPDWFDSLFTSAVRMGELSGNLEEALTELSQHLQARQALHSKLTAALTYPMILAVVGVGVVLFLMTFVIPQLLTVLSATGRPLPASTALLKGGSDFIVSYWPLLLVLVVALGVGAAIAYRRDEVRRRVELFLMRTPVLGPLLQKSLVARFAQQMALLLKTGVPFVEAVRNVTQNTGNLVLTDELAAMADSVESGTDIALTLSDSKVFPPVVAHVVAVGQDSGELTDMLIELRGRFEEEVRLALAKFATVLEPLMIVVLAAGIGFVVFACLMPILEATRGIQ